MTIGTMVAREIVHSKGGFLLCVAASVAASGLLIGALVRLAVHDARIEKLLEAKEAETKRMMEALQADVKKAMHRLGYNGIILPKDQSLEDWYAEDYAARTMPAAWAARLAETRGLAERYVPRLRRKLKWEEQKRTVIVVGTGEERILETKASQPEPLVQPLGPGECRLGFELHGGKIKPGETISIQGKPLRVVGCDGELGTKDDITIWMSLTDAQELFDLEGQINEILFVEHLDVWGNLAEVRKKVAAVLPECQVIEVASQTLARLHARREVVRQAEDSIRAEKEKQATLRGERTRMTLYVGLIGFFFCTLWIGLFMFLNVRERTAEMAILSAIGFSAERLKRLVLAKALLIGITGGVLGAVCGGIAGYRGADGLTLDVSRVFAAITLGILVSLGAGLLGSWLPARSAARQDPALVLGGE
ncbi:MAG: ABC transporter permease [Kiritimatiellia bacterium]